MSNKHVVRFSWVEALLEESKTSPCFWLPDPRDHSPNIQYDLISSRASLYKDMFVILISGNDVNKDAYEEILVKCGARLSKCYDRETGRIDMNLIRHSIAISTDQDAVIFYINQPLSGLNYTREAQPSLKELQDLKLKWFLSEHMATSILNNSLPELINDPMDIVSISSLHNASTVHSPQQHAIRQSTFDMKEVLIFFSSDHNIQLSYLLMHQLYIL